MQLGLIGLGKMGFNMRERLRAGGHDVIGFDPRPEVTDVPTLKALAESLAAPRTVTAISLVTPSASPWSCRTRSWQTACSASAISATGS